VLPIAPPDLDELASGPEEVREAAEAAGWLRDEAETPELLALRNIRPREREAAVRRSLRAPPQPDDPPLLRAWRAWALSTRRMP
jgi:hypothetical protein